ncbi:tRNA cyclic N6-threonylcarbamoyladenosine(37) synthase TcdA [Utexia brackfieldae]|uniref:tRNA cyclic N6-threonylcarbamoyladenosine(37) synthase TcdA n=1 Tax=Utexia brackfieldae TaxID=3074108 RepID=UPI00370D0D94
MHSFSEAYYRRFSGIARLYGENSLLKFSTSHVCVIGLGGVGSWAAEALARSGIGRLTLIDMDDICLTNTNRQIHALHNEIGSQKTEAMAQRIKLINPECYVEVIDDFINPENMVEYLGTKNERHFDYVLDAIDSVKDKAALIAYCKRNKIKLITIGGAGGQKDPTQIKIADLAKTVQDPLAAKVRERLKNQHGLKKDSKGKYGISCVFSTEQLTYPQQDGGVCFDKKQADGTKKMDCASGFGAITTVTATFGFVAVARILDKLANE